MNNRNIKFTSLLGASLVLLTGITSCEKQLGALPSQSKVSDNLIVDQKSAEVALSGAYYCHALCDLDSYGVEAAGNPLYTEIIPSCFSGVITSTTGDWIERGDTDDSFVESLWDALYKQMSAVNYVIDGTEALPDNMFVSGRKEGIISEAKILRAMSHSNLLRYFGYSWDLDSPYGVILRTVPATVSTIAAPRASVKDSYDSILEDCDYAIKYGPDANPNYYTNKWIAKGLKARVLMMRGTGSDYQDAADLCADIINNGPYEFEDNTTDIFHVKGLDSKEVMFGIKPKPNQTSVQRTYFAYKGYYDFVLNQNLCAMFAPSDKRVGTIFRETIDGYGDPCVIPDKHCLPGQEMVANDLEETLIEMRLTEFALLRSEALARLNQIEQSKSILREVEERAGVTDFTAFDAISTKDALIEELFKEELRNLFLEAGVEGNTMLRFPHDMVADFYHGFAKQEYYAFPIPRNEFDYNPALDPAKDQNPGY